MRIENSEVGWLGEDTSRKHWAESSFVGWSPFTHWVSHCRGYLAAVCIQSFVEITNTPDTPQLQTPHAAWAQRASFANVFGDYSWPLEHAKLDGCALTSKKCAVQKSATMLCNTTHWDPDCVLGDVRLQWWHWQCVAWDTTHVQCNHWRPGPQRQWDTFLEVDSYKKLKVDNMWIQNW